jgi:hypothetical protein
MAKRVLRMDPLEVKGRVPSAQVQRYVFEPVQVIVEMPAQEATQSVVDVYVAEAVRDAVEAPDVSPSPPAPGMEDLQLEDRPAEELVEAVDDATEIGAQAENDLVANLERLRKPGAAIDWWNREVRTDRGSWALPLTDAEQGYLEWFSQPDRPVRVRPADADQLSASERQEASQLFGEGPEAIERYVNYENRFRILNHYVNSHPATYQMLMGEYRLGRDVNPTTFFGERIYQISTGREAFTGVPVSRLEAGIDVVLALALRGAYAKGLSLARPGMIAARRGTILDKANYAQNTYNPTFSRGESARFGLGDKGALTVDQVASFLRGGLDPMHAPVNVITREGQQLILNTRTAQALEKAGIPRSRWWAIDRTGDPLYEFLAWNQLRRNRLSSAGTPTARPSGGSR